MARKLTWTRFIVWLAVMTILVTVGLVMIEVVFPPMTTDVAVGQLEDSDAAFQALRLHENAKNLVGWLEAVLMITWSLIIWAPVVAQEYARMREEFDNMTGM